MRPVAVQVLAGPGAGAMVDRLLAERKDWIAFRPRACPCCVGRVELQVELARLVRERRPHGVLIELADASHQPALLRALEEWPLAQYLHLEATPD